MIFLTNRIQFLLHNVLSSFVVADWPQSLFDPIQFSICQILKKRSVSSDLTGYCGSFGLWVIKSEILLLSVSFLFDLRSRISFNFAFCIPVPLLFELLGNSVFEKRFRALSGVSRLNLCLWR